MFSIQKEALKGISQSCKGAEQHSPRARFGMGLALSPSFRGRQTEELWLIPGKRDLTPFLYQTCKKIRPGEVSRRVGSEAMRGPSPNPISLKCLCKAPVKP